MNVNVQGLRRNVKNVVKNYTDAQVKVREATSNDPWGPPSALMNEIADLSYNVVAFTEIMQIVWKRLNDNGKNWRHVYKALVLLEYLIKVGSEKVASQCKENIFAIQTLKDFQYVEDNKDQGMNVREKSKQLVSLLKDDERLRAERMRALKAKERFAQNTNLAGATATSTSRRNPYSGSGDSTDLTSPRQELRSVLGASASELESARPQTAGEEELQLQLALAMSKEEAEQEERQRKNDDLRLQMALTESQHDAGKQGVSPPPTNGTSSKSCMDDLLGLNLGGVAAPSNSDPWGLPPPAAVAAAHHPHSSANVAAIHSAPLVGAVGGLDPWAPAASAQSADPWAPQPATHMPAAPVSDPWAVNGAVGGVSKGEIDEFDLISRQRVNSMSPNLGGNSASNSPAFDMGGLGGALGGQSGMSNGESSKMRKTPESFLGPNSNLVNLDALVTAKPPPTTVNPFGLSAPVAPVAPAPMMTAMSSSAVNQSLANPFQALNKPPTMNELRSTANTGVFGEGMMGATSHTNSGSVNPFL